MPCIRGGGALFIFLHVNQFLLALITILGLHVTGGSLDLSRSFDRERERDKKLHYRYDADAHQKEYYKKNPIEFHVTGAIWAMVVGALAFSAICVLIASFLVKFSKSMQWYYLTGCVLILIFSSVGLFTTDYGLQLSSPYDDGCHPKKDREWGDDTGRLELDEPYEPYHVPSRSPGTSTCVQYGVRGIFLFFIYVISFAHAMTFFAAFLVTLFEPQANYVVTPSPESPEESQTKVEDSSVVTPEPDVVTVDVTPASTAPGV